MQVVNSDSVNGKYLIVLTEGKDYGLFVEADGYLYKSQNFNLKKELLAPVEINIELEPIAIGSKIILNNIFFEFDSYELSATSKTELSKVLNLIAVNSFNKIEISGYTDNVGSEKYNLELSSKRAHSVYKYLVNNGVSKTKLSFIGLGASNFLKDNNSEEGRIQNRRIEFKIVE